MKNYEIISKFRRAKKNSEIKRELINWYDREQYYNVDSDVYNIHGLMGHGSFMYTANMYTEKYPWNKELANAIGTIAEWAFEDANDYFE